MALQFDGSDDLLEISDSNDFAPLTGGWTCMFWVKFSSACTLNETQGIYWQYQNGTNALFVNIMPYRSVANNIYFNFSCRGAGGSESFDGDIEIGTADIRELWYHFAVVRPENGTDQLHIYIQGTDYLTGVSRVAGNSVNPSANLEISTDSNSWWLKGILADFVVLTREVSQGDVDAHRTRKWIPDSDTGIYLPLDEGALNLAPGGLDCADVSGNGNHAVATSAPVYVDGPPIQWNRGD